MTINVILQNYRAKQIKKIFVMINPIIYILFKPINNIEGLKKNRTYK